MHRYDSRHVAGSHILISVPEDLIRNGDKRKIGGAKGVNHRPHNS